MGITVNLIIIVTLLFAGLAASRFMQAESPLTRVSLGGGIWLSIVAGYVVIYAAGRNLSSLLSKIIVTWLGVIVVIILLVSGILNNLSIVQEFAGVQARFVQELARHITLSAISVVIGSLIGIPLGIWATRSRRAAGPVFWLGNISQTIPSLALFGFLIAPLSALSFAFPVLRDVGIRGIGTAPAVIALVIYSLLPIMRNTHVGLQQIDAAVIDAGYGIGMSRNQVFRRLEVPLAAPVVMEGLRIAWVQAIGNTAVAALIGAGGLGFFIFEGLSQGASDLILIGALPVIFLALLVNVIMRWFTLLVTPKNVLRSSRDTVRAGI